MYLSENKIVAKEDYYPFGMLMPKRHYQPDGYRYAFNGKENDNEVKGDGNQQDYGMRIYDPRLGRFLSVDPLTKKYPMLSTYQFASNRPIDGGDLDGKEYYTKIILVDEKNQTVATTTIDFTNNNSEFGPKGPGVEYAYYQVGKNGVKQVGGDFIKNRHGVYTGEWNPTTNEKPKGAEDYSFKPIDELDAAAKEHDEAYDKVGATGPESAKSDINTIDADRNLVNAAQKIVDKYKFTGKSEKDNVTGKPVNTEEYLAAKVTVNVFTGYLNDKIKAKETAEKQQGEQEFQKVKDLGDIPPGY